MSDTLRPAVICEPLRTPVGRYGGVFRQLTATDLAATVLRELVARAGLGEGDVDDVLFGQCYPSGESPAIGRVAALDAGLGIETPGLQIDRRCGSSLQAVVTAAMQVQTGVSDLVIAGGAESMSQVEHYSTEMRWGAGGDGITLHDRLARARVTAGGRDYPVPGGMLETAENLREEFSIPREEQDALALRSHQKAVAAQEQGRFADEIVPVTVPQRRGEPVVVSADEHPRPETTIESLGRLRPIRGAVDPASTVTAGNASGQNDGASACIVTTPERAEALGLKPFGRLVSWAVAGVPPRTMGIGPVPATSRALERAGLKLSDIDLIELNEAFAAQVLACTRSWDFGEGDFARLNVNGSGISLGHPVGATGVRILATLLRELDRRGARYGLETMCIGGGQGMAAVFEGVG
ncbi:acetyl-CoA C-acetyltransferase [Patulibacter medicamentivorans]|uniref:acetyl-CoA C-acetyltransferase n=1 Tax=Patulibacter medicamentivorans TaxID=1097667 RepID=UPI00059052EC|nr:acetyl-CoA C-acetyltransferase [Patulibacter medicamentivorans]